jgi:hypothetical protein
MMRFIVTLPKELATYIELLKKSLEQETGKVVQPAEVVQELVRLAAKSSTILPQHILDQIN